MIGLGSNRLTVCRRGGMSVTQAGRGGMEWLAGIRYPDWATPYSAHATAALKAQFPTQWPTIKAYGFAHPEIVPYVNAYAPEDAKIAYSLVEGIGTRYCIGNNSAYIDTGLLIDYTFTYKLKFLFVSGQPFGNAGWRHTLRNTGSLEWYERVNRKGVASVTAGNTYTVECGDGYYIVNGTSINLIGDSGNVEVSSNVTIFNNRGGKGNHKFEYFELYKDGTALRKMIPFIHKDNGVNKYGMLDLLTGTFYGDATGNNGFTISETPAS